MSRSNLDEIFIFMSVIEAGSFVAGGRALGLTRSAAGKALNRLEGRLGVRLLNRSTHSLSLTDEGRVFHEHCRQVVAAIDEAEASVGHDSGTPTGVLRITAPDAFGRLYVLPLLADYLRTWPLMEAEVNLTDTIVDIVDEGYDVAIRIGVQLADSALIGRPVAEFASALCASPRYLEEKGEPGDISELAGHECLPFSSRSGRQPWRLRQDDGEWVRVGSTGRLRLDNGEAIRDAAVAGLGIAYLPRFLIDDDLAAGRLKTILPAYRTERVPIVAIYPSKRHLPSRLRRFIDLMVERWEGH